MRSINITNDERDMDALRHDVIAFAEAHPSLPVFSHEILLDTVKILHALVAISDKVLEVNGYFLKTQHIQKMNHLASLLSDEVRKALPPDELEQRCGKDEDLRGFLAEHLDDLPLLSPFNDTDDPARSTPLTLQIGKNQLNISHELIQSYMQDIYRHVCSEEIFMLACAFLNVKLSRHGNYEYLDGESPTFRETKRKRHFINLEDERQLKKYAWRLTRPYIDRGDVGKKEIKTAFRHLGRLRHFHLLKEKVLTWLRTTRESGADYRAAEVSQHFKISTHDYQRILLLAEAEGLHIPPSSDRQLNTYTLSARNHQKIQALAKRQDITPQQALNHVLEQFFVMIEVRNAALDIGAKKT